ncbi:MAG: hypothetical protein R3A12_01530 [Ignavibacteria bacterium]
MAMGGTDQFQDIFALDANNIYAVGGKISINPLTAVLSGQTLRPPLIMLLISVFILKMPIQDL